MNRHARRGSVYLAVLGVVSAVTVLTLTGIALRKELHARARSGVDSAGVHRMAQSGAELAVHAALTRPDIFVTRAESDPLVLSDDAFSGGSLRITVGDADTGAPATEGTERFAVVSEATRGDARSRLGFQIAYQDDDLRKLMDDYGAVAYWPLDETTGTTAAELMAGRSGAYSKAGAVGKQTHPHGNAAPRNYWVDEYTRVPHHSAFELRYGTIAFWAKWDILPTIADAGVISKEGDLAGSDAHFAVYLDTAGRLNAVLQEQSGDRDGGVAQSGKVITAGKWHHIAVCWGDRLCIWVDGVMVAMNGTVTVSLTSGGGVSANTRDWYFGVRNRRYYTYDPAYFTYGSVARVALFDDDLSKTQIDALRAATSVPDKLMVTPGTFARVVD